MINFSIGFLFLFCI